jgi:hypothetical protein
MLRRFGPGALALAGIALLATTSYALRAVPVGPPPPIVPQQGAVQADAVVIGKVESIGDKIVKAKNHQPGQTNEVEYTVATVKIQDGLLGAKGLTHVQVAWTQNGPVNPRFGRGFQVSLTKDQEACFFLTKHPTEPFYVVNSPAEVVDKSKPDFDKYIELTKKCAQALDDPKKGLKSKEESDRMLTAYVLVLNYRQQRFAGTPKQEPIDADESKLIMQTLADADWTKNDPTIGNLAINVFYLINPQKDDGWQQPQVIKQPNELTDAMKKWVKDNADKYRIKKLVPEKAEKTDKK